MTSPMDQSLWVDKKGPLLELCDAVDRSPVVSIDTEFAAERRYFPRFDLLQVGTPELSAAVDVRSSLDLAPLINRLCAPGRTVVLHYGQWDLSILHRRFGKVPSAIFDTALASAMVGYGDHMAYVALVRKVTGVALPKLESMTDWSRRPLRAEQIDYALDDVRYLFPLYDHLREQLVSLGRLEWLEEECRRALAPERYLPPDPRERWRRFTGWTGLSPRQLAVLQEVVAWREAYAQKEDVPPRQVLPDDVIMQLARRQPKRVAELRELRQIFDRTVKEVGEELLQAIAKGVSRGEETALQELLAGVGPELPPGVVELLMSVVRAKGEEAGMAPSLLAQPGDVEQLIRDSLASTSSQVELVQGWRRELAGRDVLRVLIGTAQVRVDPQTHRLKVEPRGAE